MDMEFYGSASREWQMRARVFAWLIKIAIIHILIIAGLMIYFPVPRSRPDIIIINSDHLKSSVNANTKDIKHIEKIIGDRVNK